MTWRWTTPATVGTLTRAVFVIQIAMDAAITKTTDIPLLDSLLEQPCDDETLAALDDVSLEDRIDQYVACLSKGSRFFRSSL